MREYNKFEMSVRFLPVIRATLPARFPMFVAIFSGDSIRRLGEGNSIFVGLH
jgi:hypothetical protein